MPSSHTAGGGVPELEMVKLKGPKEALQELLRKVVEKPPEVSSFYSSCGCG